LFINGDASLNARLNVGSDVSFNNRLFVHGDVSFNSRFNTKGDVSFNGRLFVNGDVSINSYLSIVNGVKFTSGTGYFGFDIGLANGLSTNPVIKNGICVGTASGLSPTSAQFDLAINSNYGIGFVNTGSGGVSTCLIFFDVRGGQINSTTFNATSDYRIKDNVICLDESFVVDNLKPIHYYNTSAKRHDIGFLAHEVQEHFPYLVSGKKDGPDMQSVNYNGFIGLLVKEVKQLKAELKQLKISSVFQSKIYGILFAIIFSFMLSFIKA
jgi:hypothetical protein